MNKEKIRNYTLVLVLVLCTALLHSQTPATDPNYLPVISSLSDEFNGTTINTTMWHVMGCGQACDYNWGGGHHWDASYATESGGYLWLKCTNTPACQTGTFKSSGIRANNNDWGCGYYEIYAQLPGFVDANGVGHADKFWPAFWTYYGLPLPLCSYNCHYECDIMDQGDHTYGDARTIGCTYWHPDGTLNGNNIGPGDAAHGYETFNYTAPTVLCDNGTGSNFHKIAMERDPGKIVFYVDDVPTHEWYGDTTFVNMFAQMVVIDLQLIKNDNFGNYVDFYPGTPFPQYYKVDYFRFYRLNMDCSTSVTMLNNTDVANFTWGVKNFITFGNGASTISFSSGDNKTYRAVNAITVNSDFTVPLGADVTFSPTPCY